MGFVPGITTQIEAVLTEFGSQEIMTKGVGLIKYFAVSDESSNYVTTLKLNTDQVFSLVGKLPIDNKITTIVGDTSLKLKLFVDNTTNTYKTFENDPMVMVEQTAGNLYTNDSVSLYPYVINRNDTTNNQLNWLVDLSLPFGASDNTLWNAAFSNNGYSNTAISDMNTDDILLFVIDASQQAYIDGKTIKFTLPYLNTTVDLYGSYINTNQTKQYYDPFLKETSSYLSRFGSNVVLLFCDNVQKPNNDASKSWATGYNFLNAPFSQGNKSLANYIASPGRNKDIAVGMAFLDKGVIVIFNSYLYNGYVNRTNNNILLTNRNVVKRTVANFVCDLPMGRFFRSQNPTFGTGNSVRISSIGLYNENKDLIAIGRLSSEIEKNQGQRFTFLVKLVI